MFIAAPATLLPLDITAGFTVIGRRRTQHVLLLDNNLAGQGGVGPVLTGAGHIVGRAAGVAEVLEETRVRRYDAVVVDLRPDVLGHEAIRALRAARVGVPLLLVSARGSDEARERARSAGADEVIVLPIDQDLLTARIEGLSGYREPAPRALMTVGPLELDVDTRRLRVGMRRIAVTATEFAILELLAIRGGAPVSIETIAASLDGGPDVRAVGNAINRIRRKLIPLGADRLLIKVRGLGFALRSLSAG